MMEEALRDPTEYSPFLNYGGEYDLLSNPIEMEGGLILDAAAKYLANMNGNPDAVVISLGVSAIVLTGFAGSTDFVFFLDGDNKSEGHIFKSKSVIQSFGLDLGAGIEMGFSWYSPGYNNKDAVGNIDNYSTKSFQISIGAGVISGTYSKPTDEQGNPWHGGIYGGWESVTFGVALPPPFPVKAKVAVAGRVSETTYSEPFGFNCSKEEENCNGDSGEDDDD